MSLRLDLGVHKGIKKFLNTRHDYIKYYLWFSGEDGKLRRLSEEVLKLSEILGFKNAEIEDLRARQDVISIEGRLELQRELERLHLILAENNKLLEKSKDSKEEVRVLKARLQEMQEKNLHLTSMNEALQKAQKK